MKYRIYTDREPDSFDTDELAKNLECEITGKGYSHSARSNYFEVKSKTPGENSMSVKVLSDNGFDWIEAFAEL